MNKIAQISLLCACMVVLIHVPKSNMASSFLNRSFLAIVPSGICSIAVPFFFVASGYFLGRHTHEKGWWQRAVLTRIKTLFVPYVSWCALMAALTLCIVVAANVYAGRSLVAGFFPQGLVDYLSSSFGLAILGYFMLSACARVIAVTPAAGAFAYLGRHTMPIVLLHFAAFKLVSAVLVALYGDPAWRIAMYPIAYVNWPARIVYLVFGAALPLAAAFCYYKAVDWARGKFT